MRTIHPVPSPRSSVRVLPLALVVAACLKPEADIDRTRIVGVVRADPEIVDEGPDDENGNAFAAVETEPLGFGYRVHTGVLTRFDQTDAGAPTGSSDTDCWQLVTPVDRGLSTDEGAAPAVEIELDLGPGNTRARVRVVDLVELDKDLPTLVDFVDVEGWGLLTVPLAKGNLYGLCVAGLQGEGEVPYHLAVSGRHPDDARILVGIHTNDDPADRGNLLAGTNAQAFERVAPLDPDADIAERTISLDRWAFQARYEMLFVREFTAEGEGDDVTYTVDENIDGGYLFAAGLPNLSQKLPAGTWYSSEPIWVDLSKKGDAAPWGVEEPEPRDEGDTGEEEELQLPPRTPTYPTVEVPDVVVVDAIAPMVVGQRFDEEEPNDVDIDTVPPVPEEAQDLGVLSGPGFVDIIDGAIRFDGNGGSWDNDIDGYRFEVPEPLELWFTLDWADGGADLDVIIMDDAGDFLDIGYYSHPEINEYGTGVLEPGRTYYALVLIYDAPGAAGTEYPYEFRLEQTAP